MTKGSFIEPYSDKKNPESFVLNFNKLFNDIKVNGYSDMSSPIPVDRNYNILDGAHRLACCIILGISVPIVVLSIDATDDIYDQKYFENLGINPNYLDEIVKYYINLRDKIVCINIWPSAKGHDKELYDIINQEFTIIYQKELALNENGAFYYLAQIYKEYSWAQNSEDGFSGIYRKLLPCFPNFEPVKAIFVEVEDYDKLIEIKERMRSLFTLEKHSLHITDNKAETLQMAEIVLSNNTIDFINKCNALAFKNTFSLLEEGKSICNLHNVCFTGSIVLALYGIREANDIDYISEIDNDKESHNSYLNLYNLTREQALFQPDLHFTFFDLKFLTLDCIKAFKTNRAEGKDHDDIRLIQLIQNSNGSSRKANLLRLKRRIIAKLQGFIIRFAHKTGTCDILRKVYRILAK